MANVKRDTLWMESDEPISVRNSCMVDKEPSQLGLVGARSAVGCEEKLVWVGGTTASCRGLSSC